MDNQKCELKSKFCTGLDVRKVQRIWREAGRSMRGENFNWCKGCRGLMHGGFRYVKKDGS